MKSITKIALMLITVFMLSFLASCSIFKCDICGDRKIGTKHTETILGVEYELCDDCYENYHKTEKAIENLFSGY